MSSDQQLILKDKKHGELYRASCMEYYALNPATVFLPVSPAQVKRMVNDWRSRPGSCSRWDYLPDVRYRPGSISTNRAQTTSLLLPAGLRTLPPQQIPHRVRSGCERGIACRHLYESIRAFRPAARAIAIFRLLH